MNNKIDENLANRLIDFGLSEKEALVYLALLELEVATVFQVASHSGINRSSAYVVIESLKKKGLVGISDDKKVRHYVAASPDTLLFTADSQLRRQEIIKSGIESIIPDLKALFKDTKKKPIVRIYEGALGVKEVFYDLFKGNRKTPLLTYADPSKIDKFFPELTAYNIERSKKGIKMYAINPASKDMLEYARKIRPPRGDEFALIPEEKFKFPVNMGVVGDKVSFISMDGSFGIIIESKEIAETMRYSFDLSWGEAKRQSTAIIARLQKAKR